MPNWCEGSLKVRGTKENMTRFILEGLRPVGFLGEEKAKLQIEQAKREEEALRQRSLAELEDRLQSAMDDLEKKSQIQHDAWVDALFSHIVGEEAERGDGGC